MTTRVSNLSFSGNVMLGRDTSLKLTWVSPQKKTLGAYRLGDSVNVLFKATGQNLTQDITYSVHIGSMADGMTLNPTTGRMTGVATDQQGLAEFTIRAESGSAFVDHDFRMVMGDHPAPVWVTESGLLDLVNVNTPVADNFFLFAEDVYELPVTYLITGGQLPPGVFLDINTGQLTGTYPDLEEDMEYEFTVSATNGDSGTQRTFSLYVQGIPPEGAPIWITPAGSVGEGYELSFFSTTLHAIDLEGDTITYVKIAGNIPDGLILDPDTGVLSGNLGEQPDDTQFKFIIGARALPHNTKRMFTIVVKHDPAPTFDLPGDPDEDYIFDSAFEQDAWSEAIPVIINPDLQVIFTAAGLPPEIDIDINTGVLSSAALPLVPMPREEDLEISFTVTISDGLKSASKGFKLTVLRDLPPVWQIPDDLLGEGYGGTGFESPVPLALDVYDRPVVFTLDPLTPVPEDMTFDPNLGRIYGLLPPTPTEDIELFFTITATSGRNPATKTFRIVDWYNIPPIWDSEEGLLGEMIENYASPFFVMAHDLHFVQAIQYLLVDGALPPGLSLDQLTGSIIGTANSISDPDFEIANFTVEASYFGLLPTTREFSLQVNKNKPPIWDTDPGVQIVVPALQEFSVTMSAHDPNGEPVTYEVVQNDIPADNQGLFVSETGVAGYFNLIATPESYLVRLSASDGVNQPVERDFYISVEPNEAPIWDTPADTVVIDAFEHAMVSYQLEAHDPEGEPLTYYISRGNNDIIRTGDTLISLTSNGVVQGKMPRVDEDTEYTFTARAWDNTADRLQVRYRETARQFKIMVRFNSPPVWSTPINLAQVERTAYTLTLSATGVGNAPFMTYTLTDGDLPPGLSLSNNVISGTTEAVEEDTAYVFTITADNGTKQTDRTFTFNVLVNIPPVWDTEEGVFANGLGQVPFMTQIVGHDGNTPYGAPVTYTLTDAGNVPDTLVFGVPGTVTANSNITGFITGYMPLVEADELYTFEAAIHDGLAPGVGRTFSIRNLANQDPIWSTPAGQLGIGTEEEAFTVTVAASDPEGNAVVYTLANGTNLPGDLTLTTGGLISGTLPNAVVDTDYPFQVEAYEAPTHRAYRDFYITVEHNYPPEWVTPAGMLGSVLGGMSFTGAVEASDQNNTAVITYTLFSGELPPGLTLKPNGTFGGGLSLVSANQDYTFTVDATDGTFHITRQFIIEARVNRPPVFTPGSSQLGSQREGTVFSAHIDVFDPDGEELTEQIVEGLPESLTFDIITGDLTGTIPVLNANGTVVFTYEANDGVMANTQTYTIGVQYDSPPLFITNTIPDGVEGVSYQANTFIVADAQGAEVFYSIASGSLPSGVTLFANGAIIGICPSVIADTPFVFEVRAATLTKQSTKFFTLTVLKNTPPVWVTNVALTPGTLEGVTRTYILSATDDHGLPLTYTFEGGSLPAGWTFNPISNALAIPVSANVVGTAATVSNNTVYTFTVGASNGYIRTDRNFELTLLYNQPPVWATNAGVIASYVSPATLTGLSVHANDPEGNAVTYAMNSSVIGWPSWLTLNSTTGALTGNTPIVTSNTTVQFSVDASDANRYSTRDFAINVVPNLSKFDPHANAVVLMMHLDDTKDVSQYPAITGVTGGTFVTGNKKFGTASFDPTGNQYIDMGYNTKHDLNIPEWTVEFWAYPTASGLQCVMHNGGYTHLPSYTWWRFLISSGGLWQFACTTAGPSAQTLNLGAIKLNQWQHIAVSRGTSGVIRGYIDGVLSGNTISGVVQAQFPGLPYDLNIGGDPMNSVFSNTLLDDVRITQKQRYVAANFTVPVVQFPNPPLWNTTPAANTVLATGNEGAAVAGATPIRAIDNDSTGVMTYFVNAIGSPFTFGTVGNTGVMSGNYPAMVTDGNYSVPALARDGNGNYSSQRQFYAKSNPSSAPNMVQSWRFNRAAGSTDFSPSTGSIVSGAPTVSTNTTPVFAVAPAPHGTETAWHTGAGLGQTLMYWGLSSPGAWSFLTGSWTMEMWVYFNSIGSAGANQTLIMLGGNQFRLFNYGTPPAGPGRLSFTYVDANGPNYCTTAGANITTGSWQHIAVTRNGASRQIQLFLNGIGGPPVITGALTPPTSTFDSTFFINAASTSDRSYCFPNSYWHSLLFWNVIKYSSDFTPVWPGY